MPATSPAARRHAVLYAALALLCAISLTYRVRDTVDRFDELLHGAEIARLPFDVDLPELTITRLEPEAESAGVKPGYRLTGVAGRPIRGLNDFGVPLATTRAGNMLEFEVESGSSPAVRRVASIRLQPMRQSPARTRDWITFAIGHIALPYLCFLLGFWVAAVRIHDKRAWLVLLLLLGLAEFIGGSWRTLFGRPDWFQPISVVYQPLLANLWPMSMMLFGIYFPDRLPFDRRFPWAKWIVLGLILFRAAGINVLVDVLTLRELTAAVGIARFFRSMLPVVIALQFVAIGCFFAALGRRAANERRPDARRRLKLLYWGAAVGLTPLCLVAVLLLADVIRFQPWMLLPLNAALFVFAAAMAYVIVVHRAMDVRLVVRQGVQYLLARGTIRALQFAISAAIIVAVGLRRGPFASSPGGLQILLVGIGLAAILQIRQLAERLGRWVDRRFFRDAYDAEQILAQLSNQVRTVIETKPLLQMVADQISTALHVPRVAILLNGGGSLEPAYAVGYPTLPRVPIPESGFTDDAARAIRDTLDAELVLPLSSNRALIGVMGLGPKRSEEPFTSSDRRLLDAVAAQTGLALENSRLVAEIAAEITTREKAKREIEIAREVQQRLFPQEYPPVPGIVYAGACRPALGVGGDYYDFIPVSTSQLGIAIGDVSGKGIPAALLMATLRAYVRAQTVSGDSNLADLMAHLNRLVYESSPSNRYATLFYGQYDSRTGALRYVNAGHNAPILLRPSGEVVRLGVGGPVVGLLEHCVYQQGTVTVDCGDVFVAFTDGVSEAMNAGDEEWGEERLIETIVSSTLPPAPLIDSILQAADRFAAGAPQHDDMTLIVIARNASGHPE